MKGKMTRRQLAGTMLATAAAAQAPASAPANPSAETQSAREQNERTRDALAKAAVPMDTEPAFHYKA